MRRRLAPALAALASHVAAVTWLTWPLAAVAASHVPARFGEPASDTLLLAWALAHETRALVESWWTLPHAPAFHPARYTLFYGEAGFGALPIFAPTFLASGNPTLAINATLLAGVALTATSLHVTVHHLTRSWLAGWVAGCVFLTAHWVLWTWVVVAPNYAVLVCLPVVLLLGATGVRTARRGIALAALLVVQGLTSAYVAAAALLPVGTLALVRAARRATRGEALRLLAAAAVAAALLAAAYSGYAIVRAENPDLPRQTIYQLVRLGRSKLPWGPFAEGEPMFVSPELAALLVAGVVSRLATRRRPGEADLGPAWRAGALWLVLGFVLSLAPRAAWEGQPVSLPHAWIARWLPVYEVLREPRRLGVVGLMGISVLAGAAFAACARAVGRVSRVPLRLALAASIVAALYAAYARGFTLGRIVLERPLPRTFPVAPAPALDAALARALAAHPGPLLELPVGPDARPHVQAMYRSIHHRRPLVNGYDGYWPRGFPARMRLACRLPDPAAVAALRAATQVESILVHLDALDALAPGAGPYGCPPGVPRSAAWREAAAGRRTDLRLEAHVDGAMLFAVAR